MKEMKVTKWRYFITVFIGFWSLLVAADFVLDAHAAGQKIWGKILREAAAPAVVTLTLYLIHKDEN
jgi:hypothetical protein